MRCAWQELRSILPPWLAREADARGRDTLLELRLRLGAMPELDCMDGVCYLSRSVSREDLNFCVHTASRYSPWAAQSMAKGYLTAPGGHRIGICGDAVVNGGAMTGIRQVSSLCIRVARDFPGIGERAARLAGSILLLGPPGSGKTTLLRDLIRCISQTQTVVVVDEREELFPRAGDGMLFGGGRRLDVMSGCPKAAGIDMVLRTMGPQCIAADEITAPEDCAALQSAGWCGVRLLTTAHASSVQDLRSRVLYRPLVEKQLFDHILILGRDRSWHEERVGL